MVKTCLAVVCVALSVAGQAFAQDVTSIPSSNTACSQAKHDVSNVDVLYQLTRLEVAIKENTVAVKAGEAKPR